MSNVDAHRRRGKVVLMSLKPGQTIRPSPVTLREPDSGPWISAGPAGFLPDQGHVLA